MWLLILSSPAIPTNVNALRHGLAARGSGAYAPSQRCDARVAPAAADRYRAPGRPHPRTLIMRPLPSPGPLGRMVLGLAHHFAQARLGVLKTPGLRQHHFQSMIAGWQNEPKFMGLS